MYFPSNCSQVTRTSFFRSCFLQLLSLSLPLTDPVAGYQCQFCPSSFVHRERLLCHLEKHTGLSFFRCFVCLKKFSSERYLVRHVQRTHSRVESFPCHLCPSKFSRKDTLVAHIRKHQADIAKC